MNFTAVAVVISTLLIVAFALSITPPIVEVGYTPLEKLKALDYVAVVNALVHAQEGGSFESLLRQELDAPFRVVELIVEPQEKRAVVAVDHGWANVSVEAYLRLVVLSNSTEYTPGGSVTVYRVRVETDRPVSLAFNTTAVPLGGGEYLVRGAFYVEDTRGLRVEP